MMAILSLSLRENLVLAHAKPTRVVWGGVLVHMMKRKEYGNVEIRSLLSSGYKWRGVVFGVVW